MSAVRRPPLDDTAEMPLAVPLQLSVNAALMRRLDALEATVQRLTKKVAYLEGEHTV